MNNRNRGRQLVIRDPEDLRDRYYQPTLRRLPDRKELPGYFNEIMGQSNYYVRDQGDEGTCTGQALASLIDIQRHLSAGDGTAEPVSARMLYDRARTQGGAKPDDGDGVTSLRALIKGFYHYGVCSEATWDDKPESDGEDGLTVERAKEAREITLGAYYRLRPFLNDYHAALAEADGILVSAEIHRGWYDRAMSGAKKTANSGVIRPTSDDHGAHAFVIVGYTDKGFLILNSWGDDWGGYDGKRGIALWPYEDWAERIMDAWVLRLGVRAPSAFSQTVGSQGINFDFDAIRSSSSACHQLLGHFMHLDDGKHVDVGNYASNRGSVTRTAKRLQEKPRPVLLSITGSLLDLKTAFDMQVRQRAMVESAGLYPYSVFWCNDAVESGNTVLSHLFDQAVARVGLRALTLPDVIEKTTRGFGRAYWRDVQHAADVAGAHVYGTPEPDGIGGATTQDGALAHLLGSLSGCEGVDLHVVVDGAGILPFLAYLESSFGNSETADGKARRQAFFDKTASFTMIAPTVEYERLAYLADDLIDAVSARDKNAVTLWAPSEALEDKLHVGPYERSIVDLVLYSFEGRTRDTETVSPDDPRKRSYDRIKHAYIGMSKQRSDIEARARADTKLSRLRVRTIDQPDADRRHYEQTHVVYNEKCQRAVIENIKKIQSRLNASRR